MVKLSSQIFLGKGFNYLHNPNLVHKQSILIIWAVHVVVMEGAKGYCINMLASVGEGGIYTQKISILNPRGLVDDPSTLAKLKVKELKNGRFATFPMFGFFV